MPACHDAERMPASQLCSKFSTKESGLVALEFFIVFFFFFGIVMNNKYWQKVAYLISFFVNHVC